ncbi:MAG: hypothetical protein ACTS3F_15150 [Phycisphaerales bacterium]
MPDRSAINRQQEIARAQAIREAQQRARMNQMNQAASQRSAGRSNAQETPIDSGTGTGADSDGARTTSGAGGSTGATGNSGGTPGAATGSAGLSNSGATAAGRGGSGATTGGGTSAPALSGGGGSGGNNIVGGNTDVDPQAVFRTAVIDAADCPELQGFVSVDLYLSFSQPLGILTVDSSGSDQVRIVGGKLQQIAGGGNTSPNAGLIATDPCIEFDSYFDLGGVPLTFAAGPTLGTGADQTITATWFTISPAQTSPRGNRHEIRIARFTAPTTIEDITGTLTVSYTITGLQGATPVEITLPSVVSTFVGDPPPSGGTPPEGGEGEEPEEPEQPVDPVGFGACCFAITGECQDGLSEDDCDALGGVYQGDETDCDAIECPQPPPGGGGGQPGGGDPGGGGGGERPPGGGGGEPRPPEEEEEEEPVGVTGFWLPIDNAGVQCNQDIALQPDLGGALTFDLYLRMPAPHRVLLVESNPANNRLKIDGGSVYHHPAGNNQEPNPALIPAAPCLAFDSFLVFEDVAEPIAVPQPSAPSIIGLGSGGGVSALSETSWTGAFGALWFLTPPPSVLGEQNPAVFGDNQFYVRIGRFTLPPGVSISGSLNANLTLAGTGESASVKGIMVPSIPVAP